MRTRGPATCCPFRTAHARGLCDQHYQQFQRRVKLDPSLAEKFPKKVQTRVGTALERKRAAGREHYRALPKHIKRDRFLRGEYGITNEQYEAQKTKQEGKCAICQELPVSGKLVVDHDHSTGTFRGLLCHPCNSFIGRVREKIPRLESAINYLERGGNVGF